MYSCEILFEYTNFVVLRPKDVLTDQYTTLINHAHVGEWVSAHVVRRFVHELKLNKGNAAATRSQGKISKTGVFIMVKHQGATWKP
jgi:hypothetical protein